MKKWQYIPKAAKTYKNYTSDEKVAVYYLS